MTEKYYRKSIISKLATELSISARKRIINVFNNAFTPLPTTSILDLGVTSEDDLSANFLEKVYPYPNMITCAGAQDQELFKKDYPAFKFVKILPGEVLPFKDNQFDIVYSHAVVEHTGSRKEQAAFIAEALRVSKAFFITTPNRWFPVEHHTHVPFLHYLPQHLFRKYLTLKGEIFYSLEKNLNLLTASELHKLLPSNISTEMLSIWS